MQSGMVFQARLRNQILVTVIFEICLKFENRQVAEKLEQILLKTRGQILTSGNISVVIY
jgi:hypothetical protein